MNPFHISDELLIGYAAKELDDEQTHLIAAHLGACAECRELVASFRWVRGLARGDFDQDPPSAVVEHAYAIFRQPLPAPTVSPQPAPRRPIVPSVSWWSQLLQSLGGRLVVPATAALALFIVLILGQATIASADSSLPGDWLYPIKLNVEGLQLATTFDPNDKTELLLNIAQKRLDEAKSLNQQHRYTLIPQTVSAYEDAVYAATTMLDDLAQANSLTDTLNNTADGDLSQKITTLGELLNQVPPQAQSAIQRAIDTSQTHQTEIIKNKDKAKPANPQRSTPTRTRTPTPTRPGTPSAKSTPDNRPEPRNTPRPDETSEPKDKTEKTPAGKPTEKSEHSSSAEPTENPRPDNRPPSQTVGPSRTPTPSRTPNSKNESSRSSSPDEGQPRK